MEPSAAAGRGKAASIAILLLCEVGAMAVWFSSTAVVAVLQARQGVPASQAALLTSGVQAGFVAERICRYADLVGRERVLAGSDCGFGTFAGFGAVDPEIAWAKLATLKEGARRAG